MFTENPCFFGVIRLESTYFAKICRKGNLPIFSIGLYFNELSRWVAYVINSLENSGLIFSGLNMELGVVETVEIEDHPWFVAGQFHPELKSRVNKAHPLFREFIKASVKGIK